MTFLQKSMKVVKDYFFILALVATFIGFSAFKFTDGKRQTNYYKLVGQEYRMVDINSGSCQPPSEEDCLWLIESEELTIHQDDVESAEPFGQGEFNGSFITE